MRRVVAPGLSFRSYVRLFFLRSPRLRGSARDIPARLLNVRPPPPNVVGRRREQRALYSQRIMLELDVTIRSCISNAACLTVIAVYTHIIALSLHRVSFAR